MYPSKESPSLGTFVFNAGLSISSDDVILNKVVINKKPRNIFHKLYIYILFYIKIIYVLLTKKYEYVYAHYVSHVALPIALCLLLKKNIKVVSHVHGGDVKHLDGYSGFFFRLKLFFSKLLIHKSFKIIVPSNYYKRFIINEFLLDNDRDVIVYPSGGVDTALFSYSDVKRRHKTLGYAGRLIKSKNVDVIIESMVHLENYNLEIVGDGSEVDKLKLLAEKLNISDRVLFLPPKSQKELSDWYKTIHALIYPSSSESLGLVPIEAMSCGAHVVLSHIPAFNELSDIGFNVQIMPSISADSIVTSLMHTENLSDSERKSNSFLVDKLFAADKVKEVLLNVFK